MSKAKMSGQSHINRPVIDRKEKTILVVEDDRTHRTLMEKILGDFHFKTVPAENGVIALSKFDSGQKFDLIIMDWDMPELDGLETTKAIREREVNSSSKHTPIIAFTTNRQPGDREKCIAAGMDAYLPKDAWLPRWRETLIDGLHALLDGKLDLEDFENMPTIMHPLNTEQHFDLDAFDSGAFEQSAALLKDEIAIAVEEYFEDAAAYIRDIREGLSTGDAEKAAHGSHPLKSNSKGFGLTAVSQIAEAINEKARTGEMEGLDALLAQLNDAFNRAEKKLREFIKRSGY